MFHLKVASLSPPSPRDLRALIDCRMILAFYDCCTRIHRYETVFFLFSWLTRAQAKFRSTCFGLSSAPRVRRTSKPAKTKRIDKSIPESCWRTSKPAKTKSIDRASQRAACCSSAQRQRVGKSQLPPALSGPRTGLTLCFGVFQEKRCPTCGCCPNTRQSVADELTLRSKDKNNQR